MPRHFIVVALLVAAITPAVADELKTIDNPGGGQIVYGSLTGITSLENAMVFVLRKVHGHFGDRPQVGKFFQAGDSHSVATFFTVNAAQNGGGGKPISGLAIVTMPEGSEPAAAVLYDDSARFARTEPAMMKRLNQAWRSTATRTEGAAPASKELHMTTGGDRSASIGLPAGWRLTNVAGGQLLAEGPNNERMGLGVMYQQIHDQPARNFGGGVALVCPRGSDLFSAYVNLTNQVRRSRNLPPASFRLISSQNLPRSQYEARVIQAIMELDLHDGVGPRKGSARIGAMYSPGLPTWAMTISGSNAPVAVADAESATMLAMIRSYSQDARVINQETSAVIDRIHATARAAQIRSDAQSAVNDSRNRAFDAHMDNLDRYSKSFQNYQLDRSQLHDNDFNARGTADNGAADALVRANPNRFHIVPTQDFIKGVDY